MSTLGIKDCADFHVWCHLIQLHRLCAHCALASPITPFLQRYHQRNLIGCSYSTSVILAALRGTNIRPALSFPFCNASLRLEPLVH